MAKNIVKRKSKRRYVWRPRSEGLLIELWAEKFQELRSRRKNLPTYREMASILARNDVEVTAEEIQTKVHNLTKRYRFEKGKIGSSPSTWEHFNKVDEILGKFKINNETNLIEDNLLCETLNDQSTFMYCESLPSLPSPSMSAPSRSSGISAPAIKKKSGDQNNITKIVNAMETALEKQQEALVKMVDDMKEFDERNFRLLSRLVDSTVETNNAVKTYFNTRHEKYYFNEKQRKRYS